MGARTKSRKRALDILFEADQRGVNVQGLLLERLARPMAQTALPEYAVTLVEGVVRTWSEINDLLATYSQGWTVERMPAVDRAILRLATWELLHSDEVPEAVTISEAVALAKDLSTDDSPAFINGLLGRIAEIRHTL
ncbi:MAG: transcription antitermination factor NusB [Actinomycetales bacterium]|nr:transcription antitermination factor NusB [Actinomycetales bacterium]